MRAQRGWRGVDEQNSTGATHAILQAARPDSLRAAFPDILKPAGP
jgi:hypothetical protein